MGNNKFVLAGILGGICYFLLGSLFYGMLLKDFFTANQGIAPGVNKEMPILWILFIGNLGFSFMMATIFSWGNITSAAGGAKSGAIIGFLSTVGFDFIMYATTNIANKMAVLADIATITVMSCIAGAVIGMILGKGKQQA